MRRIAILLAAIVVSVLVSTGAGLAESYSGTQQQMSSNQENPKVTVMTRNVYHGVDAELNQVAAARSFPEFLAATAAVYDGYIKGVAETVEVGSTWSGSRSSRERRRAGLGGRVLEVPVPGKMARALREGTQVAPEGRYGEIRWEEFLDRVVRRSEKGRNLHG